MTDPFIGRVRGCSALVSHWALDRVFVLMHWDLLLCVSRLG